jgi:subtilisin-like proprotein convertase family protein
MTTSRRHPAALLLSALIALVLAAPAAAGTHTQNSDIAIPAVGNAATYPSELVVGNEFGLITDVDVRLSEPAHDDPNDLDIYLRSPEGTEVILLSDACGGGGLEGPLTFDQDGPSTYSSATDCSNFDGPPKDEMPGDMPPTAGLNLDALNGENANGRWRLYVTDDFDNGGEAGNNIGSWSLDIQIGSSLIHIPGDSNDGIPPADPYPAELDVLTPPGEVITDLDVKLDGLTHNRNADVDMFVEGPTGQKVWLVSDVCGNVGQWTDDDITLDDEAAAAFPENAGEVAQCSEARWRPTTYDDASELSFTAPAPSLPPSSATSLSAFDLTDPAGTWRLWIADDNEGWDGFIINGYDLEMTTRAAAPVRFAVGAQTVTEGSTLTVDIIRDSSVGALGAGSIVVATASGTAVAGQDFTPVSQLLTFAPGETTKTISVPVLTDGPCEPEHGFSLLLGQPEGDATAGTPGALGITIPGDVGGVCDDIPTTNEDPPPPSRFRASNSIVAPAARRCKRRGQTIRIRPRMPQGVAVVRSEVFVNGKKIEDNVEEAAVAPIVLTMRGRRMRVRIRLTAHDGRIINFRRTYRRCKKRNAT